MMKYQSAIVLAIGLFTIQGGGGTAIGDTSPAVVALAVKTGMVTGVSAHDIQIDGYSYKIKAGAEILDQEGAPLMESEGVPFPVTKIVLDSAVKVFLKAGEIQKMIVTFPQ
ncbi:MAG: hypothetical protein Q8L77_09835 [Nitrospirota bacterium]|nr:hypothetical protein [Nitrospirota bacterium]